MQQSMAMSSPRTYAGATASQRRSARRSALMEATLDLVEAHGVAGVTMRAVCARARLNDRYFYESFRTVDELLLAAIDDQIAQLTQQMVAAILAAPADPQLRAHAVIAAGLDFLTTDSRRRRLVVESQATEALRARRQQLITQLATIMAAQGRELVGESTSAQPDIDLSALLLVAGGLELVTLWMRGDLDIARNQLQDFLINIITSRADRPD
jgi:AcrR family transcriptional regulator